MTRSGTLAGYALVALALVVLQWRARRGGRPTLGQLVDALAARAPTRWPLLAGWLWLGWHLFTRATS